MRQGKFLIGRICVAVLCVALLLVPGLTMASVWTPVNLVVAIVGITFSALIAAWLPSWKWAAAVVTSPLIAVPPYPYWLFSDDNGRWYFHFFHGFNLHNLPLPTFGLVFAIAVALFGLLFWAMAGLRRKNIVS